MTKRTKEPRLGGLLLEGAREKAGVSRADMWFGYRQLCERFELEPKSQYTVTKWMQGAHDPTAIDFFLLAAVLNESLTGADQFPDFTTLPDHPISPHPARSESR